MVSTGKRILDKIFLGELDLFETDPGHREIFGGTSSQSYGGRKLDNVRQKTPKYQITHSLYLVNRSLVLKYCPTSDIHYITFCYQLVIFNRVKPLARRAQS